MSSTKKTATKATKKVVKKTTKKAVKKTVAKKAPAKKASPEKVAKKTTKKSSSSKGKKLVNASEANCFWVNEGPILQNMMELEKALSAMSEDMFAYHVSKDKNDFADWVEHVLKDLDTAVALRKSKKPNTAHKIIIKQLKLYKLPE